MVQRKARVFRCINQHEDMKTFVVFVDSWADGSPWRCDIATVENDHDAAVAAAIAATDMVDDQWGWAGTDGRVAMFSYFGLSEV